MKRQLLPAGSSGFTLLELLTVVAIIAILAGMAVVTYQKYSARAASSELVELYDALREKTVAEAAGASMDPCGDPPLSLVPGADLYSDYAELSIVKADLNYAKPLGLHIKADVATEGQHNTDIVREAHDLLNRSNRVAPGAVVNDSAVSFTALLTNGPCKASTRTQPFIADKTSSPAAQAAAEQASKDLATATTPQDALEKIAALAASVPESELTAVIPGPNAQALQKIGCDVTRLIPAGRPCQDMIRGDCKAQYGDVLTTECIPAQICPKSAGVCTGVTPDMKTLLDQSIIRIREQMRAQGNDPDALGFGIY
jgi:prepilin-type N-terminal cleavage/methylation domain-containing protein